MKRTGIIGHPVAHSLSPAFQEAAFRECGLAVTYERWDTPSAALRPRTESLRDDQFLGANVTIPHKEAVIPYLDELGGQSARVGAVNTIVNRGGRLFGFNTDGPGFVRALENEARFRTEGRRILLIGAGGAARGIAFALREARAERIGIWNRNPSRARRLVEDVTDGTCEVAVEPDLRRLLPVECVVNCTSVGMHGGPEPEGVPIDVALLAPATLVVDIVYAPEDTPLLRAAQAAGLPSLGGLPMLIYQGGLAFELWTGVPAPIEVMFEAARKALRERERLATR